ncbi:MAG: hypothetical protein EXS38_07635 [Opitutus sp.]|nr:hypothetical protein [Opitutus sp.]
MTRRGMSSREICPDSWHDPFLHPALSNAEIAALYNGGSGLAIAAIPEPAAYAVSLSLIALLFAARRPRAA